MTSQVLHHVRAVVLLGRRGAVALTRVAVVGHDKENVLEFGFGAGDGGLYLGKTPKRRLNE